MVERGLKDRSIEYVHTTLRKSLKAAVVDRLINHKPHRRSQTAKDAYRCR
jgi:hypothetical protein